MGEKGSILFSRNIAEKKHKSTNSKVDSATSNSRAPRNNKMSTLMSQVNRNIKSSKTNLKDNMEGFLGGRRKSNKFSILNGIAVNSSMQALNFSGFQGGGGMGRLQELAGNGSIMQE